MQIFRTLAIAAFALIPLAALAAPVAIPADAARGSVIPNSFIVVLKEDISQADFTAHTAFVENLHAEAIKKRSSSASLAGLGATYNLGTLKGYAGAFDQETVDQINAREEVLYVEEDKVVTADSLVTQSNVPSWGLARVSHTRDGATSYVYDSTAGQGTFAYVIDTGILTTHTQFGGRATWGSNFVNNANTDENGHGTHVSGTIAGSTFGIAKSANLIAVKVLDASGSGSISGVMSGIQWAANDASSKNRSTKSVANMSLGGSFSATMNSAVANAVASGITFAVAAGNENQNAANDSPASEASAITVGATTETDSRASFSNFGTIVDIFAPGQDITSSYIGSNSATAVLSGTSMATPHITGLSAYLISLKGVSGPTAVVAALQNIAQSGAISSAGSGSPNLLAYNGSGQ